MVTAFVPLAIFAGVSATAFFTFFSFWGSVNQRATARVQSLAERLDRAGVTVGSQELVLTLVAGVTIVWISLLLMLHTAPLTSIVLLPIVAGTATFGFYGFIQFRIARRLGAFINQLEPATRLIAGGLRVGLGVRQSMAVVIDELSEPARHEFRRVIGHTNLGASIFDAVDHLATRMPSHEALMLARVFRVQSETGGDLARILDQLADTIKDRRQVGRKISSLTAEGRMSAYVLMAIPLALGLFIVTTQENMSTALLHTMIGHIVILIVLALEVLAYLWLKALLRMDV
ncbi:MAG: type II secretion system F family protein [Candidatus Eremiobacteraeota bacterium]|nr:type II secretion system F family protein [Candidatus Eremiobacteraeota bacterium]